MDFRIEPMVVKDFDELLTHPRGDDIVNAPFEPLCWPVTTDAEAQARKDYHFRRVRHRFLTDPSARFMKAVDRKTGRIASMASRHYYAHGYDTPNEYWKSKDSLAPPGTRGERPAGLNWGAFEHILEMTKLRTNWVPNHEPVWCRSAISKRRVG